MEDSNQYKFYGVEPEKLDPEFIAGIIVGTGSFLWTKTKDKSVPCFTLKMHIDEFDLLLNIKYSLELQERVYEYRHSGRHYGLLMVRSFPGLRKLIEEIGPKLKGVKREQFLRWFQRFNDEGVSPQNRALYQIFKNQFEAN